jgi:O-antigen/teichoic acid export membrane protein
MPIVAVAALSASANGGFFLAWQLLGIAAFVQIALTSILYASASRDAESLTHWARVTLGLSLGTAVLTALGLWVLGPFVLGLFGRGYADTGAQALVALPLTLFGAAIKGHYVTIHRVRGTVVVAARLVSIGAVLEIAGGYVGGSLDGLRGLGFGVVVAMALEIIPMFPIIDRVILRPRHPLPAAPWRSRQEGAGVAPPSNAPRSGGEAPAESPDAGGTPRPSAGEPASTR